MCILYIMLQKQQNKYRIAIYNSSKILYKQVKYMHVAFFFDASVSYQNALEQHFEFCRVNSCHIVNWATKAVFLLLFSLISVFRQKPHRIRRPVLVLAELRALPVPHIYYCNKKVSGMLHLKCIYRVYHLQPFIKHFYDFFKHIAIVRNFHFIF